MTVKVRPVTRADLGPLFDLKTTPEQRAFVAPNEITLAEAAYEVGSYVFVICANTVPVGLIAIIDMTEHDDVKPEDEPTSAFIWRLLIGAEHQGHGYGKAALEWAFEWAHNKGRPRVSIEVEPDNEAAMKLYKRLGFQPTGVTYGDVVQLVKQVDKSRP